MKTSFQTISYKDQYIQGHYDKAKLRVSVQMEHRTLEGRSVENMKRRIRKEIERTKDFVNKDDFTRLENDSNGNPRYYLPFYMTTEEKARACGATIYRGKRYGQGWVFQSYSLESDCKILNGER